MEFIQEPAVLAARGQHGHATTAHGRHFRTPVASFVKALTPEIFVGNITETLEGIPFIPKIESEGEAEEVSADQLPPETNAMPQAEKDVVISVAKLGKEREQDSGNDRLHICACS
eukprot:GHVQ01009285.1.p5 GENE.GHVQ01009285.1~~GHVQ01009285.1.p5  ORF type:complete len:115 (-),score=12.40 GHVQ01009285.1:2092-2436(-)